MRVALDATALGSGRGGDETYLRSVLSGLAAVTPEDGPDRFHLYLRPGAVLPADLARHGAFASEPMPWGPKPVRYAITLPRLMFRQAPRPDLLYTQTHAPLVSPTPVVLQLTDLSYWRHPEYYPPLTRLRLNLLLPLHAWQARVVLVPSEFSRRDFLAAYRLPPDRVMVVPIAPPTRHAPAADAGEPATVLDRFGVRRPFFLYVGNLHPRKNIPRLIEAFARARRVGSELKDHQLVIAGDRWWNDGAAERAARNAPPGSVVLTGRVTDEERHHLLRLAQALVYPSLFEGFGLPPLEAMELGTPVLASNVTSIPEVTGDAGLLVDPLDVDALALGLVRLATDAGLRRDLSERGRRRAAYFTDRLVGERALAAFRWAAGAPEVRRAGRETSRP